MEYEGYYPKVIEHIACRHFNVGDRVKAFFEGEWVPGTVNRVYRKKQGKPPYTLIRTDRRVSNDPNALLGGFGLEGRVDEPCTRFEDEPAGGAEIYRRTYERELTVPEREEEADLPF